MQQNNIFKLVFVLTSKAYEIYGNVNNVSLSITKTVVNRTIYWFSITNDGMSLRMLERCKANVVYTFACVLLAINQLTLISKNKLIVKHEKLETNRW